MVDYIHRLRMLALQRERGVQPAIRGRETESVVRPDKLPRMTLVPGQIDPLILGLPEPYALDPKRCPSLRTMFHAHQMDRTITLQCVNKPGHGGGCHYINPGNKR